MYSDTNSNIYKAREHVPYTHVWDEGWENEQGPSPPLLCKGLSDTASLLHSQWHLKEMVRIVTLQSRLTALGEQTLPY